ncbi:hypothetical protein [Reinekea thalattae]|uniref:Uncharacterized protein n=1 Tax=Reinekea thalattae TaxID=2593301 RepID=A0A5C8Z430_9GAMM|nr:hypothetical protein [Reinekea thalattae]TXR51931.1 hypothetical protein FME95_10935 [Reinekea thalattae]
MKSLSQKVLLAVSLALMVPLSWAGCAQDIETQCVAIDENGQVSEYQSCILNACGNVYSAFVEYIFDDGNYILNSANLESKESVTRVNQLEAKPVEVSSDIKEGFECYQAIDQTLTLCGQY